MMGIGYSSDGEQVNMQDWASESDFSAAGVEDEWVNPMVDGFTEETIPDDVTYMIAVLDVNGKTGGGTLYLVEEKYLKWMEGVISGPHGEGVLPEGHYRLVSATPVSLAPADRDYNLSFTDSNGNAWWGTLEPVNVPNLGNRGGRGGRFGIHPDGVWSIGGYKDGYPTLRIPTGTHGCLGLTKSNTSGIYSDLDRILDRYTYIDVYVEHYNP